MNLVELIDYFRKGGSFEQFCKSSELDLESEVVGIFMTKPFELNKDLSFFEIEKTAGFIDYELGGVKYYQLFDFYYFLDVIEELNEERNKSLTDIDLANRLLSYAINDA